jgi:hypothetical protein
MRLDPVARRPEVGFGEKRRVRVGLRRRRSTASTAAVMADRRDHGVINPRSQQRGAARLTISPATAKTHVVRAMSKVDTRDRAQLVVFVYHSGLVEPPRP